MSCSKMMADDDGFTQVKSKRPGSPKKSRIEGLLELAKDGLANMSNEELVDKMQYLMISGNGGYSWYYGGRNYNVCNFGTKCTKKVCHHLHIPLAGPIEVCKYGNECESNYCMRAHNEEDYRATLIFIVLMLGVYNRLNNPCDSLQCDGKHSHLQWRVCNRMDGKDHHASCCDFAHSSQESFKRFMCVMLKSFPNQEDKEKIQPNILHDMAYQMLNPSNTTPTPYSDALQASDENATKNSTVDLNSEEEFPTLSATFDNMVPLKKKVKKNKKTKDNNVEDTPKDDMPKDDTPAVLPTDDKPADPPTKAKSNIPDNIMELYSAEKKKVIDNLSKICDLEETISKLETENADATKRIEELETENADATKRIEELEAKIANLNDYIVTLIIKN